MKTPNKNATHKFNIRGSETILIISILLLIIFPFYFLFISIYVPYVNGNLPFTYYDASEESRSSLLDVYIALLTLISAVFIAYFIESRVRSSREKQEQTVHILRIAELLYDKDYYIKVIAPGWEIVTKWMNWTGQDSVEYRREIIGGNYLYDYESISDHSLVRFNNETDANKVPYSNFVRFHPHFLQYDVSSGKSATPLINELSEHMVLTITLRFWNHVAILNKEGIVSVSGTNAFFKDWYRHYYRFFRQYRITADLIVEARKNDQPTWNPNEGELLRNLLYLEDEIFCFSNEDQRALEVDTKAATGMASEIWDSHRRVVLERSGIEVKPYDFKRKA